jgi:hypothetical protein
MRAERVDTLDFMRNSFSFSPKKQKKREKKLKNECAYYILIIYYFTYKIIYNIL